MILRLQAQPHLIRNGFTEGIRMKIWTVSWTTFLQTICPKVALISAGEANSYGHPHKETLERLQRMKCKVLTTIKNGAEKYGLKSGSLTSALLEGRHNFGGHIWYYAKDAI